MKIFVTGAAGFLGRHIVDALKAENHELVTLVRPTSDTGYLSENGVELIKGDLRDESAIAMAMQDVDAVVHAAAALRGKWTEFYGINVGVTQKLLESSVKHNIKRFVFISSIIVYDHSTAIPGQMFREEMPYEEREQTFYCKTKIAAEKYVNEFCKKHDLATVILRPAALYGKHGPLFVSRLGLPIGENKYVVFGNGNTPLALSSAEKVAQAVLLSLEKEAAVGKTYNVVEDETMTQNQYVAKIRNAVLPRFLALKVPYGIARGLAISSEWLLGKVGMTSPLSLSYMRLCATPFRYSNKKIKDELGWKPLEDMDRSIHTMMQWHCEKRQPSHHAWLGSSKVNIPSDERLRAGIIGCGVIAGPHLDALRRLSNAEVAAVCDPIAEAREEVAGKYGVPQTYADYQEMLRKENLDVIHVCTPAQNHAEIALAAIKHGCHVLVEKPMAMNAGEARKMVAAAEKNRVKLCVDHNHVFDDVMIKARALLAAGSIGRPVYVEGLYGNSFSSNASSNYLSYEGRNNWAYGLPGSLYQNFISHPISLVMDVMDSARLKDVRAMYHRIVPHMQSDELYADLENDKMHGLLRLSMAVSPRYLTLSVYGTEGTLRIDFLNRFVFVDKPMSRLPRVIGRSLMAFKQARILLGASMRNFFAGLFGRYNLYQGNETLIRLFYRSILLDEPEPISPQQGLRSMEIMDEIWKKLPKSNGAVALKSQKTPTSRSSTSRKRNSAKKTTKDKALIE